jgi:heme-degrading monooxygenase HmoA
MEHHIVQFNVARLRAPLDDPLISEFVEALDPINALADATPGFVWRLQTDSGNATDIRLYDDESVVVNMSVWDRLESLRAFVYSSEHKRYLARRHEWFTPMDGHYLVLWWVPASVIPDPREGVKRLAYLNEHGPSPQAFTFRQSFSAPADDRPSAEVGKRDV